MGGGARGAGGPFDSGTLCGAGDAQSGPMGIAQRFEWSENAPHRDVWGQTGAVPGASALVVLPMRSAPAGRVPIYGQKVYVARHRCRVRGVLYDDV